MGYIRKQQVRLWRIQFTKRGETHPDFGLAASYTPRLDAASLVVPGEYLTDTTMTNKQLTRDVTGSDTQVCQVYNTSSHVLR